MSNDKIRQNSYEKYLHITHIHQAMDITIGEFPSYILQVPNHAFSNHPNKGRGDRDLGQCMASTNYSCISTSNSWQCVQCQLTGWHQSTGPSLHKEREAPWTEQDQWLVSVGPKWCWLSDCTYNCVCVFGSGGEWATWQYSMKDFSELPLMPWLPGSQPPSKEKQLLRSQCRETPGQNL